MANSSVIASPCQALARLRRKRRTPRRTRSSERRTAHRTSRGSLPSGQDSRRGLLPTSPPPRPLPFGVAKVRRCPASRIRPGAAALPAGTAWAGRPEPGTPPADSGLPAPPRPRSSALETRISRRSLRTSQPVRSGRQMSSSIRSYSFAARRASASSAVPGLVDRVATGCEVQSDYAPKWRLVFDDQDPLGHVRPRVLSLDARRASAPTGSAHNSVAV